MKMRSDQLSNAARDLVLAVPYQFVVVPDTNGRLFVKYPDLPGCFTEVDSLADLAEAADEARRLWLEAAYESGQPIPVPAADHEFSGKFNLRLPRSLHRALVESAEAEGVSLNQYAVMLLASGDASGRLLHQGVVASVNQHQQTYLMHVEFSQHRPPLHAVPTLRLATAA